MVCQHIFERDASGEVLCRLCLVLDDEMEASEPKPRHDKDIKINVLDEKYLQGFPSGDDGFWSTQVSFE